MQRSHWRPWDSDRRRKFIQRAVDVYNYNTRNPSQLLTHIKRKAAFNVTDPHLSLYKHPLMKPDYEKKTSAVYGDAGRYFLSSQNRDKKLGN
jgi:hypothetical protein